ncbi:hypothetical protein E8E12_010674 [Didymella heteroderae]|uniref:Uncharacterized protein n=1 Tax=Didymella heteroderae TaxID=1769908 RepID=A0A9P4WYT5_9PLEO|nr:hypothetical protein E8E12_010674 [Didymella heteroderae]
MVKFESGDTSTGVYNEYEDDVESVSTVGGVVGKLPTVVGVESNTIGALLPLDDVKVAVACGSGLEGTVAGTVDLLQLKTKLLDSRLRIDMIILAGDDSGNNACDNFKVLGETADGLGNETELNEPSAVGEVADAADAISSPLLDEILEPVEGVTNNILAEKLDDRSADSFKDREYPALAE